MANLGKWVAQLGSANIENTMALANANFNFSLVRLEPPKEYAELGAALTQARRDDAETGTAHMTARKLGALFEQVIEPATELLKAYGHRVSEISTSKLANLGGSHGHGLFERHVGPDGTVIWASATSGKTALAVSLLASLLARLWSGPEAISIWVELVAERKRQIKETCDGSEASHIASIHAAMQEITRKELAEWDASARAWLRTADEVKKSEQLRCRLITNNLNISVDKKLDVYGSVVRAWQTAMQMMEKLIQGMPQRVHNGAILLAISAWHLYPDMVVLGNEEKLVRQQDPLIATGGCLTVGLESANPDHKNDGVYWSLSLAHLRFYGDPILAHRSVGNDASRVTFRSFTLVALGSFLRGWRKRSSDLVAGADLVSAVWERINREVGCPGKSQDDAHTSILGGFIACKTNWLAFLAHAAGDLLGSRIKDREEMQLLIQAGARYGSSFLGDEPPKAPAFGLCDVSRWLQWSEDTEQCIGLLRNLAMKRKWDDRVLIIRYVNQVSGEFDLATVFPIPRGSSKRYQDGTEARAKSHKRWILSEAVTDYTSNYCKCPKGVCLSNACSCRKHGLLCRFECHRTSSTINKCTNNRKNCIEQLEAFRRKAPYEEYHLIDRRHTKITADNEILSWYNAPTPVAAIGRTGEGGSLEPSFDEPAEISSIEASGAPLDEEPVTPPRISPMDIEQDVLESNLWSGHRTTEMHRLVGDAKIAAIFVVDDRAKREQEMQVEELEIQDVTEMLRTKNDNNQHLALYIGSEWASCQGSIYLRSLKAFAAAANIYKLLPNATVELKTISQTIGTRRWVPDSPKKRVIANDRLKPSTTMYERAFEAFDLGRAQTLACLAMFETGTMDIRPRVLENAMAMAMGNSIYVPASLVCDPHEAPKQHELARIVGNIGRPGVSILLSPQNLRIRKPSIGKWRVVNHKDFDGEFKNSFASTSLHLSFTGYDLPVEDVVTYGAQDIEASFVESVVSVHEHGKWVADIDILAAIQDPKFRRLPSTRCWHYTRAAALPFQATSIDNWDEYLERPENACVFRAQDNKLARLAATAVGVQMGKFTIVAKDSICAKCCIEKTPGWRNTTDGFSEVNFIL